LPAFLERSWVLNDAVKKGLMTSNPVAKMDRPKIKRCGVSIHEPAAIRAFPNHALEKDHEMLPAFIFGYFAGLRPNGELLALDWSHTPGLARTGRSSSSGKTSVKKRGNSAAVRIPAA